MWKYVNRTCFFPQFIRGSLVCVCACALYSKIAIEFFSYPREIRPKQQQQQNNNNHQTNRGKLKPEQHATHKYVLFENNSKW